MFAVLKLQHMLERKNPDLTTFVVEDAFDTTEQYSMDQNSFMVAVAAEHYLDGPKSDPRYVKWIASYQIGTDESFE